MQFLIEVFTPQASAEKLASIERRLSNATGAARFVRATYIPEDELCFFVFDAPSGTDAALAARRAGLDPIRVVAAVSSDKEER